jgi:molybdopterin/thiamine biosynthesis adenylyltransferase
VIYRLAMTDELFEELAERLDDARESAGFILAGRAELDDGVTLLGRRVLWVPQEVYARREPDRLEIPSLGFVPALKATADDGAVPVFFHTHPGGAAAPSQLDRAVDESLRDPAQLRTDQHLYATLILGGHRGAEQVGGTLHYGHNETPLHSVRVVGRQLRVFGSDGGAIDAAIFDRQIRAFGEAGQRKLASLHVGVVGAGGTGSAVVEQLARLGVGRLTVIDDDVVTPTNVTRIHESGCADADDPKVTVMARAIDRIGLGTDTRVIDSRITQLETARALRGCDVVFGCTDDNRGRAILSRLAYWYLVPVIDCAFMVDTDDGAVRGLFGRVTTVQPGAACLACRGRIDLALLGVESLEPAERERLAAEGYVPGLGEPDPSVGAFTTLTGSLAVSELLERLFGYGGEDPPTELLLRLHDRALSTNTRPPREGHYCADRSVWARGDEEPFLGQLWA